MPSLLVRIDLMLCGSGPLHPHRNSLDVVDDSNPYADEPPHSSPHLDERPLGRPIDHCEDWSRPESNLRQAHVIGVRCQGAARWSSNETYILLKQANRRTYHRRHSGAADVEHVAERLHVVPPRKTADIRLCDAFDIIRALKALFKHGEHVARGVCVRVCVCACVCVCVCVGGGFMVGWRDGGRTGRALEQAPLPVRSDHTL